MLWMRSDAGPSDAPQPAQGPPGQPAGSSILWRRGADRPPASLVFPKGQQDMPDSQKQGGHGQVGQLRRHVTRPSALLDNVAPAGVRHPQRPPSRQPHANGSLAQGGAGTASGVTEPDEDPWRASRDDLSSSQSGGTDSPAQWIALHDASQVSSMQLHLTQVTIWQCWITET